MAYEEWNREIPPEEQLQEVAKILAKAVLRKHYHPELIPGATGETSRARAGVATARARLREGHGLDQSSDRTASRPQTSKPFDDDADIDPWRRSKRGAFWRKHCTSIEIVPPEDVGAVIFQPHLSFDQIDLHDAFYYAISMLCDDERRVADHVAEHGFRSAIRELGVTRRRVEKTLRQIRHVFCDAGFGVD